MAIQSNIFKDVAFQNFKFKNNTGELGGDIYVNKINNFNNF